MYYELLCPLNPLQIFNLFFVFQVQNLLQQMQSRFQTMSDSIISKIDDMGSRIDDLEKSIGELMKEVGLEVPASPSASGRSEGSSGITHS
ncbi:hypothetical protein O6H91_16G003200 [Diphasiastrum complanatum]|uniref:Uncharacterized protein n=1 Tax=Diphasiastrum complanatum TaxID=34168 RepID=A0ACC2B9B0_DIPCM|nr:hypothetical protein O6H91_16G003200 [Diphasiastrum complanatum]